MDEEYLDGNDDGEDSPVSSETPAEDSAEVLSEDLTELPSVRETRSLSEGEHSEVFPEGEEQSEALSKAAEQSEASAGVQFPETDEAVESKNFPTFSENLLTQAKEDGR